MIYRGNIEVFLSIHAKAQADIRGITSDMIEATIKGGKMRKFGKNLIKFEANYKAGKVVCIGEKKTGNCVKILTVEWG